MNLIGDPWIPVVDNGSNRKLLGLVDLYQEAENLRDLVATPPERVALLRLLLCITHAALDGPTDPADWLGCKSRIQESSIDYLHKWKERFNLYSRHPFLQVADLEPTNNATLDKLDFALSAGNNPTFFDHEASPEGRSHSDAWRALKLLTYQCFSPGGLIGETYWNGKKTGRTSSHAPCIESSMLHTLLIGSDLLNTLHLNLVTKTQIQSLPAGEWATPVWEVDIARPDGQQAISLTQSFLGRLVPLSRAILLSPDSLRFTLANGLAYSRLPEFREPMATVIKRIRGNKEEDSYLSIDLSKHPWRELGSLLSSDVSYRGGPLTLHNLALLRTSDDTVDIWTGGLAADRGKILDVAEWILSVPAALIGETELEAYRKGVELASSVVRSLSASVNHYYSVLKVDTRSRPTDKARTDLWSELDRQYDLLLDAASSMNETLQRDWQKVVFSAARDALNTVCPKDTPRQIQAFAQASRVLNTGLSKIFKKK